MPTTKELLKVKTHKDDGLSVRKRIFYTLTDEKNMELHRTTKLVSILLSRLVEGGEVTEDDLDTMLLEIV